MFQSSSPWLWPIARRTVSGLQLHEDSSEKSLRCKKTYFDYHSSRAGRCMAHSFGRSSTMDTFACRGNGPRGGIAREAGRLRVRLNAFVMRYRATSFLRLGEWQLTA